MKKYFFKIIIGIFFLLMLEESNDNEISSKGKKGKYFLCFFTLILSLFYFFSYKETKKELFVQHLTGTELGRELVRKDNFLQNCKYTRALHYSYNIDGKKGIWYITKLWGLNKNDEIFICSLGHFETYDVECLFRKEYFTYNLLPKEWAGNKEYGYFFDDFERDICY